MPHVYLCTGQTSPVADLVATIREICDGDDGPDTRDMLQAGDAKLGIPDQLATFGDAITALNQAMLLALYMGAGLSEATAHDLLDAKERRVFIAKMERLKGTMQWIAKQNTALDDKGK